MGRLRTAFDPDGLLNPGKILPGDGDARHAAPAQMGGMTVRDDVPGPWI